MSESVVEHDEIPGVMLRMLTLISSLTLLNKITERGDDRLFDGLLQKNGTRRGYQVHLTKRTSPLRPTRITSLRTPPCPSRRYESDTLNHRLGDRKKEEQE